MQIENRPIEELTAAMWEGNPRVISSGELNKLRKSIQDFGFQLPVIVNKSTGRVVGGHQRIRAAAMEGLKELPVTCVEITEEQEKVLNLGLNKIDGDWDYEKLNELLSGLVESEYFPSTGFDEAEVVKVLANYDIPDQGVSSFEDFVSQGMTKTLSSLIPFRSPDVIFSCTRTEYDRLVSSIQRRAGLNDAKCNKYFLGLIGLGNDA